MLNKILQTEVDRIGELIKKAENVKEERKEAIRTVYRRMQNKGGSPSAFMKHLGDHSDNGGNNGKKEELNEVEQLY